jgi:hypothetical protein
MNGRSLTATWLNGLATAATAAGAIAPAAAASFGISGGQFGWRFVVGTVIWLSAGLGLHSMARSVLWRSSLMTPIEWFGFVVAPLLLLGVGAGVVYFTGRWP